MFGAVPASLLMEIGRSAGVMTQQELDLGTPPWVFVDPKHLTSVQRGYSLYTPSGNRSGITSSDDHPCFSDTREWLGRHGYIRIERGWSNGDRVTSPFYFNNVLMDVGEQFSCGAAMGYGKYVENYNDGQPDYSIKNYNDNI